MKNLKFKTYYSAFLVAIAIFLILLLASCGRDDGTSPTPEPEEETTILDLIEEEVDYADFNELLANFADLTDLLDAENRNYTVFVPSASALSAMPQEIGYASLEEIPTTILEEILKYHLVKGQALTASDFTDGASLPTELEGQSLTVAKDGQTLTINEITVNLEKEGDAINGYVYPLEGVLIPEAFILPSMLEILTDEAEDDLTLFVTLLENHEAKVEGEDITVFAPTNEAMEAFMEANGIDELGNIPVEAVERLIQMHVVSGAWKEADLESDQELSTGLGESLLVTFENGYTYVDDAALVENDFIARNGNLHKVNSVLLPEDEKGYDGTYAGYLYFNIAHQKFWNLINVDVIDMFTEQSSNSPFFNSTLLLTEDTAIPFESEFVQNYFFTGEQFISGLYDVESISEQSEVSSSIITFKRFYLSEVGNKVYINGSSEIIGEKSFNNNTRKILMLDYPIDDIGYLENIPEYLEARATDTENPEFTQFYAALQKVESEGTLELLTILSAEEADMIAAPYTVFAPTDEAFYNLYNKLDAADLDEFVEEVGIIALQNILVYNIMAEVRTFTPDFFNDSSLGMANGEEVTVNPNTLVLTDLDQHLNLGSSDATITEVNILATNGVIHIIDQVLLP